MGYPYYKRFPRDFFEGTIGMTFEVKAAYGLLLDLIFIRDGRLPDDPRFIAGHLGLSVRKWNTIRATLLSWPNADGSAGKIKADLGIISNSRADNLTIDRRSSPDYLEIIGTDIGENNELQAPRAEARARASESEPEDRIDAALTARESVDDWPPGKPFDHAQLLVVEAESVNFSIDRSPGLAQGITALHRWRRDGASWEHDVVPVVTALARKARSPIKSWSYFEDAVTQNIAATRAALTIPEHTDVPRPDRSVDERVAARRRGALEALAAIEGENAVRAGSGRGGDG